MRNSGKKWRFRSALSDHDTGRGSLIPYSEGLKSIRVPCLTLADVFHKENIDAVDFLKVDCEGSEEEIFYNTPEEILSKISSITVEWHDNLSKFGFAAFKAYFERSGFRVGFDPRTSIFYAERDHK